MTPPIHDRKQAIEAAQRRLREVVGRGLTLNETNAICQTVDALGIGTTDHEEGEAIQRGEIAALHEAFTRQVERAGRAEERLHVYERAIIEHRTAIHNAGTVKVQPGYEPTVEAKHRADERLWAVLSVGQEQDKP